MLIAILCIAIIFLVYHYDIKKRLVTLEKEEANELQLKQTFKVKQKRAVNLDLYKQQLEEMQRTFGSMLRQLPSKTEIPGLIVDISQTGLASGLEIDLFKPQAEVKQEFYVEKPIDIRVKGNYHEFGKFASGVAALPRIVTLHDITLTPGNDGGLMTMSAVAKTYRYLDEDEE